jgi:cobalt/nickel transport system permease protein
MAKMLALFNLTWLLLALYAPTTLLRALAALGVPRTLVTLLWLTQRYLLVFEEELRRLRLALRVRGFRNRMSRQAWQTAGYAVGSLLIHGLDRADRVAHAWRLRGDGGLWLPSDPPRWSRADVGILVVGLGVAAVPWLAKAFSTSVP